MGDSSPAAPTRQVVSEIRLVQLSESFVSQVPGGGAKLMWRGGPVILMLDCGKDPTMVYNGIYIYIHMCVYIILEYFIHVNQNLFSDMFVSHRVKQCHGFGDVVEMLLAFNDDAVHY